MTKVFVEQSLALPGSANYIDIDISLAIHDITRDTSWAIFILTETSLWLKMVLTERVTCN